MLQSLRALIAPALAERLTLAFNHALGQEPAATARLRPYAGRTLALVPSGWPELLPPLPQLRWRITPAGMLEWEAAGDALSDLTLHLDAGNPALLLASTLSGETPTVRIEGDSQLASEVNWLMQNLRWDAASDLERLFGPRVAAPLLQLGGALASGLRAALKGASALGDRWRSRAP